jgi:hypothetical protein
MPRQRQPDPPIAYAVARCDDSYLLGAIWGFTSPFERIWRFWRFDFTQELPSGETS